MLVARPLKAAAAAALSSMVAALAIAGPMAGTALASRPGASVAPVVTSDLPSLRTSTTGVTFTWSSTASESFTCFLDGAKANCGSGTSAHKTYSGLSAGSHSFFVRGKQAGHFRAVQSNTLTWNIDHTPPGPPSVNGPASPTNNPTPQVTFVANSQGTEPVSGFACVLSATQPATAPTAPNCTSPWTPSSALADGGTYTLWVYAFDTAVPQPNASAPNTATWSVDLGAPGVPQLKTTPTLLTNSTSAAFSWTDDAGTTSACSLDNQPFTSCGGTGQPRNVSYPGPLVEGDHTFVVQDTDSASNTGAPQPFSWHIDLTSPDAPVVNGPGTTDNTTATFSYSDSDKTVSFLCQLDGVGGFAPCQTSYGSLADANHELDVKAQDPAGNLSTVTAYTWTVDTTATGPVALSPVTILDRPDAFSNQSPFTFTWLALDETTTSFLCALDTSTFTACGPVDANGDGSHQVTVTSEGPHVFAVKAADNNNNVSPPTSWRWTYDKTPPPPPDFSSKPSDPSNSTSALFSFASEPNASFTCSLDGAAAQPCATPATFNALSTGNHTFAVTAVDAAGNTSTSSYSWTIDLAAPAAPLLTGPAGYVSSASANISWTDADGSATFTCALDGVAATGCFSPATPSNLSEGTHTFAVTATNSSAKTATAQISWIVDTIKPVLHVNNVPADNALTSASFVAPSISQNENNQGAPSCSLAGPDAASTCGPYPSLHDGTYTLTVTTSDLAGNAADAVVTHWTVDTTKPVINLTGVPAEGTSVKANSFTPGVTQTEAHQGALSCALTGAATVNTCGPYQNLADGAYTLTVNTTDLAGNAADAVVRQWSVDTTKPVINLTGVPAEGTSVKANSFTPGITQTEAHQGALSCALTGAATVNTCGPYQNLADGAYTLTVNTTDLAGNAATPVVRHWSVDTTPPPAPSVTDLSTPTNTQPTFTLSDSESPVTFTCAVDAPTFSSCTSPYQVPSALAVGSHKVLVRASDVLGNTSAPTQLDFAVTAPSGGPVDSTPPTAALAATTTLKGASTAKFSETVRSLSSGGAALVLTGTSTVVPSTVVCLTNTTVAACSGTFNALRVTPKSALMPGQHYTVRLLTNAVQDTSGNQLAATSLNFRGSRAEQETTPGVKTVWSKGKAKAAYGGSFVRENTARASATYTFHGTNVTWFTTTGPDQGKATVFIDGVKKGIVNNYAAAVHFKVAHKYGRLANKRHTIRIVVRGVKGSKAGTGTFVTVDAFKVGRKTVNTPALTTGWRSLAAKQLSGGHAAVAKVKGEALTFTFRGTAIGWLTERGRSQGKVAVYVDGVKKAVVDNYAAATKFRVKRSLAGLADKVHTLKLVVLGTHHKGGTGTWVTVDRFLVT